MRSLRFVAFLATTYPKFFERLVDHQYGGVFHKRTNTSLIEFAKAHLWKNGYHESEHALVGYLTSQALRGQPASLFFAFHARAVNRLARPYVFDGDAGAAETMPFSAHDGYDRVRVVFQRVE